MSRILVYNMSGELDDLSHLFPNERLARLGAILRGGGADAEVWDRANLFSLASIGGETLSDLGNLDYLETSELHRAHVEAETARILGGGFDVVLLNLWHGSGFKFTADLARSLREAKPGIRLYGVGQKVDWFKEHILELPGNALDGLLSGLGYNAAARIAAHGVLTPGPNAIIAAPEGPKIWDKVAFQVDDFSDPSYGPKHYRGITGKLPVHPVTLSNQACPNFCRFCLRPDNYGRDNIPRSVDRVFHEILGVFQGTGVRHFRVEDSTPPAGTMTQLALRILDSPMAGEVRLSGFSRVDTNRDEDFTILREAGMLALFFGIESMDPETLAALGKGFDPDQVQSTIEAVHAAGIATVGSFIYPAPGQTRAQLNRNLAGIERLCGTLDSLIALPAGVYPLTEWGRHPARYKIELEDDFIAKAAIFPIKHIQPMHLWPDPPFRYEVLGKAAADVRFADIVAAFEEFLGVVRQDMGFPGMPDYYYLLADLLGRPPGDAVPQMVKRMVTRDYSGLAGAFGISLDG